MMEPSCVGTSRPTPSLHNHAKIYQAMLLSHPCLLIEGSGLAMNNHQTESWGPFVILHPDPLEPIQEESRHSFPPRRDSKATMPSQARRRRGPTTNPAPRYMQRDHQDKHPEVGDEIIDMYASGWKAELPHYNRRDTTDTHSSDPTPLTSSWDDSSDSDTDTVTPNRNKWRKAVNVAKGRLKQIKSKENLLDLPGLRKKGSQASLRSQTPQPSPPSPPSRKSTSVPLVRISSVSKLERHYGYTSPELQKIGIDSSCRVSGKEWTGRWG